jgi:hypothetical protein
MDLDEAAAHVHKGLMMLADELREVGLPEHAHRCDTMAQMLSRAIYDQLTKTQPIDVPKREG